MAQKITRFEDIIAWQRARELTKSVYNLTKKSPFRNDSGLSDQVRRATVSIMANIAEGFERGTNVEFIQFLYIARGSAGEVRSHLYAAADAGYLDDGEFDKARDLSLRVSGAIAGLLRILKASPEKGQKFRKPPRKSTAEIVDEILVSMGHPPLEEGKKPKP